MQSIEPIRRLVAALSKLPGIGEKTASRLALFILNADESYARELSASVADVKKSVSLCSSCMAFSDVDPCALCSDSGRDHGTVCVVSDYKDLTAIEASGNYHGLYHVLHGALAPLKGVGPDKIRVAELARRLENGGIREAILATAFDAEGEATAAYLARLIKPLGIKVTRIASGVPVGSFIEYMDGSTLGRAMDGRRDF